MKRGLSLFLTLIMVLGIFTVIPVTVNAATSTDIVESVSIDKTLMSEGETATITIKVAEGYTAEWIYFYKPITNNTKTVYLYLVSDNTYTGTFKVDDQTEAGIWKVRNLTLENSSGNWEYLYNSDNYTGTYYDKIDFSSLNFEVIGTNADVTAPVLESYSRNKNTVSIGENITFTAKVIDEHLPTSFYLYYKSPSNESEAISMKKIDNTGLYQGAFTINSETEIGLWKPYYFYISDTNQNIYSLYNSKVTNYASNKADLSSLNFEVVDINNGSNENSESFIVVFKDGYGNTLSTQRIAKGESAIAPDAPTNELYLFNGWDTDFSNVTSNLIVTATWVVDPNAVYDYEIHQGSSFNIEVFSQASQDYTITCSEDIDFTSSLYGTSYTVTNLGYYYGKEYKITVKDAGSYLFYVKGSRSSNTLSYKVKVTPHAYNIETISPTCIAQGYTKHTCSICNSYYCSDYVEKTEHTWATDYTIDVNETCATDGLKSIHCTYCNGVKEGSQTIVPATGDHTASEWIIDEAATCTATGLRHKDCTVCGETLETEVIPVKNHTAGDWAIDIPATVSAPGSKHKECTVCGETLETVAIPQLKPTTPKVATENALTGVLVKWNAVDGAVKYNVYRRQGGSNTWTLVGATTSTSLTDTKVSSGIYYVYSVRAYNNAGQYSDFVSANTQTRKYMAVPKLKGISNATNGLYITWNPVAGVTNGYRVYRRGAGSTYWTYLGTTKNTYFTDTAVKNNSGEYFRYTVIADGGYHSKFDTTGLYLRRLSNPTLKSAVSSKTGITVKWTPVKGCLGYYVYRKTANSGWVRVGVVNGVNSSSFVDKTAQKGVTYTYTIRAVCGSYISYFNSGISCKDKY